MAQSTMHRYFADDQIHTPFRWVFADASAREAAQPDATDLRKLAYQVSDGSVWVLAELTPVTWSPVGDPNLGTAARCDVGVEVGNVPQLVDAGGGRAALPPEVGGGVPVGAMLPFGGETAPLGWLKCNGAAITRTAYAALFEAIGTAFGEGDGSTTFNIPDTRGVVLRGVDDGRGLDAGRVLGTYQGDANREHAHTVSGVITNYQSGTANRYGVNSGSTIYNNRNPAGTSTSGGTESRMKNLAVHHIIKY
jgi:microcystin-dependent protein